MINNMNPTQLESEGFVLEEYLKGLCKRRMVDDGEEGEEEFEMDFISL